MKHFKPISYDDRKDMFTVVSNQLSLSEGIIEKDFWVCFVLDYLFNDSPWKDSLAFKGGTSLSKCYQIINRFSEDIDLVLDWDLLGFKNLKLDVSLSQNQKNKLKRDILAKSNQFLNQEILPKILNDFSSLIDEPFSLYLENGDSICFAYPKIFDEVSLLNEVRLEIGALSAWSPTEKISINTYASSYFPSMFNSRDFKITSILAKRTFWEKIIILHKTNYRVDSRFPNRYARHYYDIAMFYSSEYFEEALEDKFLRQDVLLFNEVFYDKSDFHLELAIPGHFKLVPDQSLLSVIEKDYILMSRMFFNTYPSFEELVEIIKVVEERINQLES